MKERALAMEYGTQITGFLLGTAIGATLGLIFAKYNDSETEKESVNLSFTEESDDGKKKRREIINSAKYNKKQCFDTKVAYHKSNLKESFR